MSQILAKNLRPILLVELKLKVMIIKPMTIECP